MIEIKKDITRNFSQLIIFTLNNVEVFKLIKLLTFKKVKYYPKQYQSIDKLSSYHQSLKSWIEYFLLSVSNLSFSSPIVSSSWKDVVQIVWMNSFAKQINKLNRNVINILLIKKAVQLCSQIDKWMFGNLTSLSICSSIFPISQQNINWKK